MADLPLKSYNGIWTFMVTNWNPSLHQISPLPKRYSKLARNPENLTSLIQEKTLRNPVGRSRHGTEKKWKRRKMMRGSGGRSRPPVGSRGKAPGRGLGATPPEAESFFSVCHHKKQHSGAWKSDICKSASFMFRPDIYLAILKIENVILVVKKNKILAKVPNHLTATVS